MANMGKNSLEIDSNALLGIKYKENKISNIDLRKMLWDVIVVGAGPAGATIGEELAKKKYKIIIIDKEVFPRDKICASGLMQHALDEFPYLYDALDCINTSVRVYSPNLETNFVISSDEELNEKPLMAMSKGRKHLDHFLLERAKDEGAYLLLGEKVIDVKEDINFVQITTSSGKEVKGKILVGADSVNSTIAKKMSIGSYSVRFKEIGISNMRGIGIEKEFQLSKNECEKYFGKEREVILFLYFNGLPGYAWVFPRTESVNIGIGGMLAHGKMLGRAFKDLIEYLKNINKLPKEFNYKNSKAAQLSAFLPSEENCTKRIILIGDAGGFCSIATGEGIYYSMKSGKLISDVVDYLLKKKEWNKKELKRKYMNSIKQLLKDLEFQYKAFDLVLSDQRRSRKAINWGSQDEKLRNLFGRFLVGALPQKRLPVKMLMQYIRCKIKEKLGKFPKPKSDIEFERKLKEV